MTMMMVELIRLTGDERWEEWGDDWWDHVERVAEVPGYGWSGGSVISAGRQIDWGAVLHEASKTRLVETLGAETRLARSYAHKNNEPYPATIGDLPEGQYGFVVVECY